MPSAPVPTRITIDFHDALHPARGWILGLGDQEGRVELLAFDRPQSAETVVASAAELSGCTCPEFCERDHDNE